MQIATASAKGILFEGATFQVLCIRRLSKRINATAAPAVTKLNTVNVIEAIDVPPNNWVMLLAKPGLIGAESLGMNIPI